MRKSLLAFVAAVSTLTASAFTADQQCHAFHPGLRAGISSKSNIGAFMKAPDATGPGDIITEVEGIRTDMSVRGSGYYTDYYSITGFKDKTTAGHVVYSGDKDVYIYNILPFAATDSYVKGVRDGDKVVVDLPQTVKWYDGEDYGAQLDMFECVKPSDGTTTTPSSYRVSETVKSVTFSVAEDGSMKADGLDLASNLLLGLGYTDDSTWTYFGVYELSLTPFSETRVEAPADIEVSKDFWSYNAGEYGWPVSRAQGYDEIYFQGLCGSFPEAWVKGSVEYGDDAAVISVPQDQYMGVCEDFYIFTKAARLTYSQENDYWYYKLMPEDYVYELIWNYEDNTIVAADPDVALLFNSGKDAVYYLEAIKDLKLTHQDDFAGVPADPYDLQFFDYLAQAGEAAFHFLVPAVSKDGKVLISGDLSYVVLVDGEEWLFDPEDYLLNEEMIEIPWAFDSRDIANEGGIERTVFFFMEGISTLGVQSIYRYGGEETRSNVVTINAEDNAVEGMESDRMVKDVRFFSLDGRRVAEPAAGIFVKRVTYGDGSVRTFKTVVR